MKLRERSFNFSMVGIYNKTAGHDNVSFKVLNSLYKYLNYHNNALICLGDFNVNLLSTSKSKLHDIIYKIIREYDLTDIGNIFGNSPTWRGKGNRAKSISRLDLVLTNLNRKKIQLYFTSNYKRTCSASLQILSWTSNRHLKLYS